MAKTYTTECTQEKFDRLPGLVPRAVFMDWTGLNKGDLQKEVAAGRIRAYWSRPGGYAKYYKKEIARLTGFKM
jgi:hypothetical protein